MKVENRAGRFPELTEGVQMGKRNKQLTERQAVEMFQYLGIVKMRELIEILKMELNSQQSQLPTVATVR